MLGLLATVIQLFFVYVVGGQMQLRQTLDFSPQMAEDSLATKEFVVRDKPRKITVRNTTTLDNNWIGLDMMLVNKASGEAWPASREIAYYFGNDGGESWSEGNRDERSSSSIFHPAPTMLRSTPICRQKIRHRCAPRWKFPAVVSAGQTMRC